MWSLSSPENQQPLIRSNQQSLLEFHEDKLLFLEVLTGLSILLCLFAALIIPSDLLNQPRFPIFLPMHSRLVFRTQICLGSFSKCQVYFLTLQEYHLYQCGSHCIKQTLHLNLLLLSQDNKISRSITKSDLKRP